ncbi:MAG: hypothetical protein Kow0067_17090 [Coriobacteriia bacterium]
MSRRSRKDRAGEGALGTPAEQGSDYPRRRTHVEREPHEVMATGYRTSRRSSKAGKRARKNAKSERRKAEVAQRVRQTGVRIARGAVVGLGGAVVLVLVLFLVATGINAAARWWAERQAAEETSPEAIKERAKENLLIIGTGENQGADFLAVRLDRDNEQILGIAIPDGAFMEVPGQGFERVGDSLRAGPEVSLATISNYLSVPFEKYVIVDKATYQSALTDQTLRGMIAAVTESNLEAAELQDIADFADRVSTENVALVPLPVKPISLGDQTFFEPQREEVAELLYSWWGVKVGAEDTMVRVIVYNGAGIPGIAGEAAQELIGAGMRVVDTKNADRFDYGQTLIVVQNGDTAAGERVREVLRVGEIIDQPSDQDVADIIVIIGQDYVPADAEQTEG